MSCNVVVGAGGPTGRECVKRLLSRSELPVRAVVRDLEKYRTAFDNNPRLELVEGDVTDKASLQSALQDARGVIFAASGSTYWSASDVDFKGVANVAEVCSQLKVQRVVLVSSQLVSPHNRWNPLRIMLNNIRSSLMDNKYKGEEALRASSVSYTIVRPGHLSDKPPGQHLIIAGQGDKLGGDPISRSDVAAVCVEALTNPQADRITLEIGSRAKEPSKSLEDNVRSLFDGLKPNTK